MTEKPASSDRIRRIVRRLVLAFATSVFALFVLGAACAASATADAPDRVGVVATDVDRAVADLVGPAPADAIVHLPAGFEETMGYRPVMEDSRPVNPAGSCSSPIPLPARFEPVCRAHDFGYDLLRFGRSTGHPSPPWARRALDGMLVDAMHESCTDPLCEVAAAVADGGLSANSWRQGWQTPTAESAGDVVSSSALRVAESLGARR